MRIPSFGQLKEDIRDPQLKRKLTQYQGALRSIIGNKNVRDETITAAVQGTMSARDIMQTHISHNRIDFTHPRWEGFGLGKKSGYLGTWLNTVIECINQTQGLQYIQSPTNHHTIQRLHDALTFHWGSLSGGPHGTFDDHLNYHSDAIVQRGLIGNTIHFTPSDVPPQYSSMLLNGLGSHAYINRIARAYPTDYLEHCAANNHAPASIRTYMFAVAELYDIERANKKGADFHRTESFRYQTYATSEEMSALEQFFIDHVERKNKHPLTITPAEAKVVQLSPQLKLFGEQTTTAGQ